MSDILFDNLMKQTKQPITKYNFVNKAVIICPTYNRRNFLPNLNVYTYNKNIFYGNIYTINLYTHNG